MLDEEGVSGLFKGFGAMIMQYAFHLALLKFSATLFTEVAKFIRQETGPPPSDVLAQVSLHLIYTMRVFITI